MPRPLEKNVCSAVFEWNVLYISTKSIWSHMSFKDNVSLLIFSLYDPLFDVSRESESPNIIVLLSISLFRSVNICSIYLGASMLAAYIFTSVILFSCDLIPFFSAMFVFLSLFLCIYHRFGLWLS